MTMASTSVISPCALTSSLIARVPSRRLEPPVGRHRPAWITLRIPRWAWLSHFGTRVRRRVGHPPDGYPAHRADVFQIGTPGRVCPTPYSVTDLTNARGLSQRELRGESEADAMARSHVVDAAREHLLAQGTVPEHLAKDIRPAVLQSWRRSLLSGAELANPSLTFRGTHHARAALR